MIYINNIGKSMTIDNKDSTQSYDEHSKNVVSGVTSLSPSSTEPEKRIRTYANKAKQLTPVGSKQKRKRGRPSKKEMEYVALKTKRKKSPLVSKREETAKIRELMARMLITNGDRVLKKTIDIAMQDEHPHQMAALKLLMDRALPVSIFEKDKQLNKGVTINISNVATEPQQVTIDSVDSIDSVEQ